jgi:hypothetical protein
VRSSISINFYTNLDTSVDRKLQQPNPLALLQFVSIIARFILIPKLVQVFVIHVNSSKCDNWCTEKATHIPNMLTLLVWNMHLIEIKY